MHTSKKKNVVHWALSAILIAPQRFLFAPRSLEQNKELEESVQGGRTMVKARNYQIRNIVICLFYVLFTLTACMSDKME